MSDDESHFKEGFLEIEKIVEPFLYNKQFIEKLSNSKPLLHPTKEYSPQLDLTQAKVSINELDLPNGFILNIVPIIPSKSRDDFKESPQTFSEEERIKAEQNRNNINKEIIKTEREFYEDLELFETVYFGDLQKLSKTETKKQISKTPIFFVYCFLN